VSVEFSSSSTSPALLRTPDIKARWREAQVSHGVQCTHTNSSRQASSQYQETHIYIDSYRCLTHPM
jgi:hypothetical protein